MEKIAVVCASGIGDALILQIASHQLKVAGFETVTDTPHRFGRWFEKNSFGSWKDADAIFLQHDNSLISKEIHQSSLPVYTFYGSHQLKKHGPLRPGMDFVCNPDQTMVDNVVEALKTLFQIPATTNNGITPPKELVHRKYANRIAIHPGSSQLEKNWPLEKFEKVATSLRSRGYDPVLIPHMPTLDDLLSFIYESGFFLGNDSGPGHIASCLDIPHLIIAKNEKQMRLWRPGWGPGQIALPPKWIPPAFKEKYWTKLISTNSIINKLNSNHIYN